MLLCLVRGRRQQLQIKHLKGIHAEEDVEIVFETKMFDNWMLEKLMFDN